VNIKLFYHTEDKMKTKKRNFLIGLAGISLALGMMALTGCDDGGSGGGGGSDTWHQVTSVAQVNGTWRGSFTITELVDGLPGISMKTVVDITQTINASAGNGVMNLVYTLTFSGAGIAEIWPMIKEGFAEPGTNVDDSKYSISGTEMDTGSISDSDFDEIAINQSGTKLKYPAGMMIEGSPEFIMYKQ
jgi:hypothetical protein